MDFYEGWNTIDFKYPQTSHTLKNVPKGKILRFKLRALNDCGKAGPATEATVNTNK